MKRMMQRTMLVLMIITTLALSSNISADQFETTVSIGLENGCNGVAMVVGVATGYRISGVVLHGNIYFTIQYPHKGEIIGVEVETNAGDAKYGIMRGTRTQVADISLPKGATDFEARVLYMPLEAGVMRLILTKTMSPLGLKPFKAEIGIRIDPAPVMAPGRQEKEEPELIDIDKILAEAADQSRHKLATSWGRIKSRT